MWFGWPPTLGNHGVVDELQRIRGARVLRELLRNRNRAARVSESIATFSSTVPKRIAFQICGSFSSERRMHLA